jgi:hypothetical protein
MQDNPSTVSLYEELNLIEPIELAEIEALNIKLGVIVVPRLKQFKCFIKVFVTLKFLLVEK